MRTRFILKVIAIISTILMLSCSKNCPCVVHSSHDYGDLFEKRYQYRLKGDGQGFIDIDSDVYYQLGDTIIY